MAELPFSFRHLSLTQGLRAAMLRQPDKVAYRHKDKTRTYSQLTERIDRLTAALVGGLGLRVGEHIGIVAQNSIEYMEVVFASAQAGNPLATINPKLATPELTAICDDAEARVLFVDQEVGATLRDARFSSVERIVVIGSELEDLISRGQTGGSLPVVPEWTTFTIPYTSGTTGKPKGVLVGHRSRILTLFGMAVEYGCFGCDDRFLAIAPMCHGAGLIFSLAPVFFGGYAEILDKFEPELVVSRLSGGSMTGFFGVPTHFHALMAIEAATRQRLRPTSLRTIISNAAPLPQAIKEQLIPYFGDGLLHETYGSTEGGIVTNLRPPDQLRKLQCVGQPFPGTLVEIRRGDGSLCENDEVGELFSTSPYLFNGYWKRPADTEEAYHAGWVSVGDLARRDAEGHFYIVDRKKDMVISGGVNIYPREVEEILYQHPQLLDAAVIGVPDEKWGEKLRAFVVTRAGTSVTAEEILRFCEGRISKIKIPKEVEFIERIPRNASGKVLKTHLRIRS